MVFCGPFLTGYYRIVPAKTGLQGGFDTPPRPPTLPLGAWAIFNMYTRRCKRYGQTDGNPMIEPVRLPALRVHDGRARSVQRSDAMVNGRFDEKGPLIGDVARHVDDGAVSFGFQVLLVL